MTPIILQLPSTTLNFDTLSAVLDVKRACNECGELGGPHDEMVFAKDCPVCHGTGFEPPPQVGSVVRLRWDAQKEYPSNTRDGKIEVDSDFVCVHCKNTGKVGPAPVEFEAKVVREREIILRFPADSVSGEVELFLNKELTTYNDRPAVWNGLGFMSFYAMADYYRPFGPIVERWLVEVKNVKRVEVK